MIRYSIFATNHWVNMQLSSTQYCGKTVLWCEYKVQYISLYRTQFSINTMKGKADVGTILATIREWVESLLDYEIEQTGNSFGDRLDQSIAWERPETKQCQLNGSLKTLNSSPFMLYRPKNLCFEKKWYFWADISYKSINGALLKRWPIFYWMPPMREINCNNDALVSCRRRFPSNDSMN